MQAEREVPVVPEQVEPHNTKQRRRGNLIRKKHITLCFSLFLALSMVLGQLIPVAATDEIPAEEPQAEETVPAAEEPAAEPEPEVTAEEEPGVVPIEGTDPVQDEQPADEGQAPAESGDSAVSDKAEVLEDQNTSTYASEEITLEVGQTKTITGYNNDWAGNHSWKSSHKNIVEVQSNGSSATVTGVSEGIATITHSYELWGKTYNETFTVVVSAPTPLGQATVYVYIAAMDDDGNRYSTEMAELLGIDYNSINDSSWFAAGTVDLDLSKLADGNKKETILNSSEDWDEIISQLKSQGINTSTTVNDKNKTNRINEYIDQIIRDTVHSGNGSKLKLAAIGNAVNSNNNDGIKYQNNSSFDANGQSQNNNGAFTWHLDLRFETVHINYLYGCNNIPTGSCKDGDPAGSKVFIRGATMDKTPEIGVLPEGYKVAGYYTTSNFEPGTEWNAIGEPITEDTTVYIRIVPMDNSVINYVVRRGEGTVTDPSKNEAEGKTGLDSFNPKGSPAGSTAKPAEGWKFDGWYSDPDCQNLVTNEQVLIPRAPENGWQETTNITYYAKFVRASRKLTVTNTVSGNMADSNKDFEYRFELFQDDQQTSAPESVKFVKTSADGNSVEGTIAHNGTFTLKHGESVTMEIPHGYSFMTTQKDTEDKGNAPSEHKDGYKTTLTTSHTTGAQNTHVHSHSLTENEEVRYLNTKEATVPSGMNDHDTALHGLILSAGAGLLLLGAIVMIRRRMNAI